VYQKFSCFTSLYFLPFIIPKKSDKGARALLSLHLLQRVFVIFLAPIKNTFTVF